MAILRPFIIGFATTLKHLFKKPITVNYPEQRFPMFPKYRGKQVLMRDEPALRVGLPDSQDALHLLRILRGGAPCRRHVHGQGRRAGGVQQGRLHLGQGGSPGAGRNHAGTGARVIGIRDSGFAIRG